MDQELDQLETSSTQGICATLLADAPWNAKSVIASGIATVGGLASWVADLSSPALIGIGGSYLGGFFFGWAFRRFLKMAALITGGLLTCIAVLEETGWIDLDWTAVESTSATPSRPYIRELKDSNTSSLDISLQRGQERSESSSDFAKSSKTKSVRCAVPGERVIPPIGLS